MLNHQLHFNCYSKESDAKSEVKTDQNVISSDRNRCRDVTLWQLYFSSAQPLKIKLKCPHSKWLDSLFWVAHLFDGWCWNRPVWRLWNRCFLPNPCRKTAFKRLYINLLFSLTDFIKGLYILWRWRRRSKTWNAQDQARTPVFFYSNYIAVLVSVSSEWYLSDTNVRFSWRPAKRCLLGCQSRPEEKELNGHCVRPL